MFSGDPVFRVEVTEARIAAASQGLGLLGA
jgi:hypothetical protein